MNKKINNSGQAAIEFLVTYSWAIIAAMTVIGALVYFGMTNPAATLPDKCIFSNNFNCADFKITSSAVQLKLINGAGQTIFGTTGGGITAVFTDSAPGGSCTTGSPAPTFLDPDAVIEINCTNPPGSPFTAKEKARVKITLKYQKTSGGYDQVSLGEVYATVQ